MDRRLLFLAIAILAPIFLAACGKDETSDAYMNSDISKPGQKMGKKMAGAASQ